MSMTATAQLVRPQPRPLGLVWIRCPYPVLAFGLERMLRAEAYVHFGTKPPPDHPPRAVIVCPEEGDVAAQLSELKASVPDVPFLVFSLGLDLKLARTALKAGARGLIHLQMRPEQIVRAISLAYNGEVVVPRELLRCLVADEDPVDLATLTPRQLEILKLVAEGMTNAEVAQRLFLSEFTIKQHLRAAYKHLKVKNRTEAARIFRSSTW